MSRNSALVLALALGSLILPAQAFAQLTPPAGSAGAGNSAISGVPFGPANPRVPSDPSGIGNASVCTENLIRVDDVMESPKLAE
jgi:hypothetical protein